MTASRVGVMTLYVLRTMASAVFGVPAISGLRMTAFAAKVEEIVFLIVASALAVATVMVALIVAAAVREPVWVRFRTAFAVDDPAMPALKMTALAVDVPVWVRLRVAATVRPVGVKVRLTMASAANVFVPEFLKRTALTVVVGFCLGADRKEGTAT